jgi:radical SAM superfamily enzyme YgiQ (UPF0313 family)
MKALLVNPELPLSLMSFQVNARMRGAKSFSPPLGLLTIAAMLPQSWEIRLVDLNCSVLTEADWQWTDIVLVSGMILHSRSLLTIVREAKNRGKFVVVGGPYVTSIPEAAMDAGTDVLVMGEAEDVLDELLQAIEKRESGKVVQGWVKPDITKTPVPRFDLINPHHYVVMAIQTSRGCPFECEFCDVINLYGRKMRYKSPTQVVTELEAIRRIGWRGDVFISDDNFIGSKAQVTPILQEIVRWSKSHGEPFTFGTQASLNLANTPDLIDLMTEANFSRVLVGVESPDRSILALNRKMQNIDNPIVESLRLLNSRGLTVIASFVIGFDGEEKGVHERIGALVEAANVGLVFVNILQALPNTKLWNRLQREGRLLPEYTRGETLSSRLNFVPSRPEAEIAQEWADAWSYLYEPRRCLRRILRSCLAMRPTRRAMALAAGNPLPSHERREGSSWSAGVADMRGFIKLVRLQGLRLPLAYHFWKQIVVMRKRNPSRLIKYMRDCAFAADMFVLRDEIQKRSAQMIRHSRTPTRSELDSAVTAERACASR